MRILLADDHKIVRDGLRALLRREPEIEVVGEADDGRAALEMARALQPDVVIMDIGMRGLNGIDATRQILAEHPDMKIVALSMHSDRRFVAEMLKAGASAYLVKDGAFEELTTAIRAVRAGRVYLSQDVAGVVVEDYVRRLAACKEDSDAPSAGRLTMREREVLQLIAEGKTTKEIASCLHLSVKTVETHRRQIMDRLGIFSVAGLIKFAIREGLTSVEY